MGRGPHGADAGLFAPNAVSDMRLACAELSWLLGRGYAETSALALVGDRHRLRKRQRAAVSRSACAEARRVRRQAHRRQLDALRGADLAIDGFNCVITVEAALAGGVLLRGRDGALRDLASVHGSYRRVQQTAEALQRLLAEIARWQPARVTWWLDRPVSNSGRLAAMIRDAAAQVQGDTAWAVQLDFDPDHRLLDHAGIVASSDSMVLDGCRGWVDLPAAVVATVEPPPWCIDLEVTLP